LQFKQKNDFLIRKSDGLLLIYDEESHGSPKYILEAARKKQESTSYFISLITFADLQVIVEEENMKNEDYW
jgi:uncharacterized phage-like protein YoqJ